MQEHDIPPRPVVPHVIYSAGTGNRNGGSRGKQSVQRASWLPADKCVARGSYVEQQTAAISISVKDTATGRERRLMRALVVLIGAEPDTRWKQLQHMGRKVSAHLGLYTVCDFFLSPFLSSECQCTSTEPPSFHFLPHWIRASLSPLPLQSAHKEAWSYSWPGHTADIVHLLENSSLLPSSSGSSPQFISSYLIYHVVNSPLTLWFLVLFPFLIFSPPVSSCFLPVRLCLIYIFILSPLHSCYSISFPQLLSLAMLLPFLSPCFLSFHFITFACLFFLSCSYLFLSFLHVLPFHWIS